MITAARAKENVILSKANLQKYFEKIDGFIEKASLAGKSSVELCGILELTELKLEYMDLKATPLQQRIIDELVSIGYNASVIRSGASYVPIGVQDDDGEGPVYINYAILVRW